MTYDEARNLTIDERKAGIVVEGDIAPFGGSWIFDDKKNTLTLGEAPTAETEIKGEKDAN